MDVTRHIVLCVVRRGHELLAFRATDTMRGMTYHRPLGGGIEPGEAAEEALVREMREELGAEIVDARFLATSIGPSRSKAKPRGAPQTARGVTPVTARSFARPMLASMNLRKWLHGVRAGAERRSDDSLSDRVRRHHPGT